MEHWNVNLEDAAGSCLFHLKPYSPRLVINTQNPGRGKGVWLRPDPTPHGDGDTAEVVETQLPDLNQPFTITIRVTTAEGYQLSGAVSYLYLHRRPFAEFDHTFFDNGTVLTRGGE